jgi:hypothetical protein
MLCAIAGLDVSADVASRAARLVGRMRAFERDELDKVFSPYAVRLREQRDDSRNVLRKSFR